MLVQYTNMLSQFCRIGNLPQKGLAYLYGFFNSWWPHQTSRTRTEVAVGQWVMGHGSNGSTNRDGSRGSWVSTCIGTHDPLTDD